LISSSKTLKQNQQQTMSCIKLKSV